MTQSVRLKLIKNLKMATNMAWRTNNGGTFYGGVPDLGPVPVSSPGGAEDLDKLVNKFRHLVDDLEPAQTIIFPAGQASVFLDAMSRIDFSLDYTLPFSHVFLQFSEPIRDTDGIGIGALLLDQTIFDDGHALNQVDVFEDNLLSSRHMTWVEARGADMSWTGQDGIQDYQTLNAGIEPPDERKYSQFELSTGDIKNLAIACIGYINCENVYLYRESTPEAINAKRERKGKSRLEPYYVCRIRGVQYDSAGNPTGEGAKHGIRYDVRGHFRRMATGKTTWVRPHQRGLANELYIPKTYLVDKKVQP